MWFCFYSGATNPEYVVTADDVDKLIAVECIPMDDQGRQVILESVFFYVSVVEFLFVVFVCVRIKVIKMSSVFLVLTFK